MLNCRPPNLAGQAAPDGERSRSHTRAGKPSAVRGRGRPGECRACQCHRVSGNEGNPSPTKPPSRLRSIRRRSGSARRSPPGAASPWPRLLGRRAPWRRAGGNGGGSAERRHRGHCAGGEGRFVAVAAGALPGVSGCHRRSPARRLPRKPSKRRDGRSERFVFLCGYHPDSIQRQLGLQDFVQMVIVGEELFQQFLLRP